MHYLRLLIAPGLAIETTIHSRLPMPLAAASPESPFFDLVSSEEVEAVHELEVQGKPTSILPYVSM